MLEHGHGREKQTRKWKPEIREKGSPSEDLRSTQRVKIKKHKHGAVAERAWHHPEQQRGRKEGCLAHCGYRLVGEKVR